MGSGRCYADGHPIAFGEDVLELHVHIGEGRYEPSRCLDQSFDAHKLLKLIHLVAYEGPLQVLEDDLFGT